MLEDVEEEHDSEGDDDHAAEKKGPYLVLEKEGRSVDRRRGVKEEVWIEGGG
jgi:hypothetical protein